MSLGNQPPKILSTNSKLLLDQLFDQKNFWTQKYFWVTKNLLTRNPFWPEKFYNPKMILSRNILDPNFFWPENNFWIQYFWAQIFLSPNFFEPKYLLPQKFLRILKHFFTKFFGTRISWHCKIFFFLKFFDPIFF